MQIGPYTISQLVSDKFRLDGGAMFGSIPKALWGKRIEADEKNRIQLLCRLLVVEDKARGIKLLVDTGMGREWTEKEKVIYHIEYQTSKDLSEYLAGITHVLLTHLHFDHCGGCINSGELIFPQAVHFVSEKNWQHAHSPSLKERASYLEDNFALLNNSNLHLTQDSEEILPNIWVYQANGHTSGLQWLLIASKNQNLAYPSDLIPTSHHIHIPYTMGYDMCAETTLKEKQNFLNQAVRENWLVCFEHDSEVAAATISINEKNQFSKDEEVEIADHSCLRIKG